MARLVQLVPSGLQIAFDHPPDVPVPDRRQQGLYILLQQLSGEFGHVFLIITVTTRIVIVTDRISLLNIAYQAIQLGFDLVDTPHVQTTSLPFRLGSILFGSRGQAGSLTLHHEEL